LRYRINRLGGRAKKEKWILQAELFNEIHRWVRQTWSKIEKAQAADKRGAERYYGIVRDFSEPARKLWGDSWHDNYIGHQTGHAQGHDPRVAPI